jgi:hypothetical protein
MSADHLSSDSHYSFAPWPAVSNVKQSPLNPLQWNLTLSCGHDLWVTSKGKPRRRKARCPKCIAMEATVNE